MAGDDDRFGSISNNYFSSMLHGTKTKTYRKLSNNYGIGFRVRLRVLYGLGLGVYGLELGLGSVLL